MSIIDTFDNISEEIIKPSNLVSRQDGFPEIVVSTFTKKIIDVLLKAENIKIIDKLYAGFELPIYKLNYKGKDIAVYQTLIGSSASAGLLEEVICKGGKKFIFFGSCGVLDRNLCAGHIIVPTAAYRDEGTSYHYARPSNYIEIRTAEKLSEIFETLNLPYIKGKTWTTDAIYRETRKNMLERKKEGCITVEMECAAIMSVSHFRGVELYQYLFAGDNLDAEEWDARILGNLPESEEAKFLEIALEIAIRV